MNSEELEQSLRTEFDDYLKSVFDEMREDVSGFQAKIDSAIEDHKARMEDVFKQFTARFDNETELDEGFKSSIVEHLRLAKDEGARITAQAVENAEKFDEENRTAPEADFSQLRDALSDISKQESQADILKSLVEHASQFTPRGAFFIVKNDHFVGWRVFGKEENEDDQAIRDVFFPMSDSTVLSQAAQSLETAEGSFGSDGDEAAYLNKLGFGQPDRMYAIPLIARGRSVAVLYADYGQGGTSVNVEALETLVQIAGLTVELLAASRTPKTPKAEPQETAYADAPEMEEAEEETSYADEPETDYAEQEQVTYTDAAGTESSFASEDSQTSDSDFSYQPSYETADSGADEYEETSEPQFEYQEDSTPAEFQPVSEESEDGVEEMPDYSDDYQTGTDSYQPVTSGDDFAETPANEYQFEKNQFETQPDINQSQVEISNLDAPQFESFSTTETADSTSNDFSAPVATDDYSEVLNDYGSFETTPSFSDTQAAETVSEPVATEPVRSRFSERNVDLPIEVGEDERRLHNDARRFARLLVSEIKLYNEQKVKEGRESSDLYERLREAIDRSREMYDKRVQSPVAAKFDYFHYELVNSLADGDEAVLGDSYSGASV